MTADVYETLDGHRETIERYAQTADELQYWVEQYEDALQGDAAFDPDEVREQIDAHYLAITDRHTEAYESVVAVMSLENRVRNARRHDMAYDDLPGDEGELAQIEAAIEDIKDRYHAAKEADEDAVGTVDEELEPKLLSVPRDGLQPDQRLQRRIKVPYVDTRR